MHVNRNISTPWCRRTRLRFTLFATVELLCAQPAGGKKTKQSDQVEGELIFTWTIFLSDMPATRRFCLSSSGLNLTQYGTFLLVKREMHWPAGEREREKGRWEY